MGRGKQSATATASATRTPAVRDEVFITVTDSQRGTLAARKREWQTLAAKLLTLGGSSLVVPRHPEEDLDALLAGGQSFTEPATMMVGDPSQCHANAAGLWEEGRGRICTGYALSDDGYWRQHSWVHDGTNVIETTEEREAYYGIVLDDDAAADFAFDNW